MVAARRDRIRRRTAPHRDRQAQQERPARPVSRLSLRQRGSDGRKGLGYHAKPRRTRRGKRVHDIEELARIAIDCGLKVHRDLGPGLLESVYEVVLALNLTRAGLNVERQKPVVIEYDGIVL